MYQQSGGNPMFVSLLALSLVDASIVTLRCKELFWDSAAEDFFSTSVAKSTHSNASDLAAFSGRRRHLQTLSGVLTDLQKGRVTPGTEHA
jgi:hypothetical protein